MVKIQVQTNGDPIEAEFKGKDGFVMRSMATLIFSANELPPSPNTLNISRKVQRVYPDPLNKLDEGKQMKEKHAKRWEKIRVKGKRRYIILMTINFAVCWIIARIIFNWLNHKPYFDNFFLIIIFIFVSFMMGRSEWYRMEKKYLVYLSKKAQISEGTDSHQTV